MRMAVSLRLSDPLRKRLVRLARVRETTPHALMLEAIGEKLAAEEAREALLAEAKHRLARMKRSGAGIPASEVFAYLEARARGRPARRPGARKLA
jgi:predicted transcriptional regulator